MAIEKALLNTPADTTPNATISVNGRAVGAHAGEWLIEAIRAW
jgi:formate dehydrogenase major subunit